MKVAVVTLALAASLGLSACASKPEPTFGQLVGDRAAEYRAVRQDWQSGAALKQRGEKDIARGERDIKEGEALIKRGQRLVERGNSRVLKGSERMERAEASYSELLAAPVVPELAP